MRTLALLALCTSSFACRENFEPQIDATPPDPVLACDREKRFPMTGAKKQFDLVATRGGYYLFALDQGGTVHGSAFEFIDGQLEIKAQNVQVATGVTGAISAIAVEPDGGDSIRVVLAAPFGATAVSAAAAGPPTGNATGPTGTVLYPLDAMLVPAAPPVTHNGWVGNTDALVPKSATEMIFLAHKLGTSELYAYAVSRRGELGVAHLMDTEGTASEPHLLRTDTGYLLYWAAIDQIDVIRAKRLDTQFNPVGTTATISRDPMHDSVTPAAAYSPKSETFLFAWAVKDNGDRIGFSLRDKDLTETRGVITETRIGYAPQIAAGTEDFLVVWTHSGMDNRLGAARVAAADSTTTFPSIATTGGTSPTWDVVTRGDQPAVVWLEDGGTGDNLWFDPLCRAAPPAP